MNCEISACIRKAKYGILGRLTRSGKAKWLSLCPVHESMVARVNIRRGCDVPAAEAHRLNLRFIKNPEAPMPWRKKGRENE